MTSPADLSALSVDVYSPGGANGFELLGKPGDKESSGLQAQAYINNDTNEIVLAFAGTV